MRASGKALKASQVWDEFVSRFHSEVDDLPGVTDTATSTATNPDLAIDNNVVTACNFKAITEFAEYDFIAPVYITHVRHYGRAVHNEDGNWKLEAFIDGVWTDALLLIPTVLAVWSGWLPLDTPMGARLWRLTSTAQDTGDGWNNCMQIELRGTRIGY